MTKSELRKLVQENLRQWLTKNQNLNLSDGTSSSTIGEEAWSTVLSQEFSSRAGETWGAFIPIGLEPPIQSFLRNTKNVIWAFPAVEGAGMSFYLWNLEGSGRPGSLGTTMPPQDAALVPRERFQGFLVPGLAFDLNGTRLGRGKGYYDQFLQGFEGELVGLCYSAQVQVEPLLKDPWDIKMHRILTERGALQVET